ncbi:hypothetical protein BD560DRAFT_122803 [Blakeslea trispora]|nr:hypothetical protein BD560DRAFT_122803 [Blakeslea trispora]
MHARKIRRVASPDSKDIEAQAHKILLSIAGHAEQSQESTEGHSLSDALNCSKSVEVPSFVEDSKEVSKEEKDIKQPVEETVALATQPTTQTLPPRKWHAVPSSDSDSVIDIAEENEDEKQLNQSKEVEEKAHMFFGDDKDEDKEMALLREHIAQQSNNSFDIDAMSLDGESYAGSVNEGGNKLKRTDDLAMDYSDEEYELEDDKTPPPSSPVMAAVSGPAASFTNEVQQPTTGMSESKVTVSQKAPSQKPEHLVSKPEEFTTEVLKPQPTMPQPAVPQPVMSKPIMPQPIMPQPIMPQPIMPQSVMPQPTMPHSTMPQPDASQIYTLQLPVGKMPAYQSPSAQSPTSHQPTVPAALPSTSTQRKTSASIKTHSTGSKASQPTAVDSIATNRSHPVPRVNQNQTNSSLALTPIVLVPPQSTAPIEAANTAAESNRLAPYLSYAGNSSPLRWDNTSSTLLMPLDSTSAQTLPLPPVNSQPLVENGSSSSPSLAVEGERAVSTDRPSTAVVNFSHGSPDRYAIPNRDSTFEKIRNLGRFVHTWRIRHAPSACCICFEDNSAEPIESCDNLLCDVRLHASCYQKIKKGSTARIHRRWMCDKCTYLDSSSLTVVCALCPSTAGLFCMIDPNKYSIFWVHYNCAKTFLGENTIAYKPDLGHFDVDIDAIPLVNFEQPCSDCAKSCYSRYGAKIVCRICRTYHHITCIEQYNLKIPEEAYECPDHGSARPKGPDVLRRRRLAASYHRWIGKKNHYLLEEFKKVPRMFGLDYWKSLNLETLSMGKVTEWYRKSIAVIQKTESYPVENTYYNQWVNYVYGLTMSTYSAYEIKNAKVTFSSKHFDEDIGYDFQIANTLTPPRNNTLAVTQSSRAESSRAESSRAESSRAEVIKNTDREGARRQGTGTSKEGTSREGTSRKGTSRKGTSREGTRREGTSRKGTSKKGTSRRRTGERNADRNRTGRKDEFSESESRYSSNNNNRSETVNSSSTNTNSFFK